MRLNIDANFSTPPRLSRRLYVQRYANVLFGRQAHRKIPSHDPRTNMTTITHIRTESDLDAALAALVAADPRFDAVLAKSGRPPLRRRPDGYVGLAATVVSQQLSTASAAAIWGRLTAAFDPFEPQAIIKARPQKLARLGLSRPKIKALKEIARAVARGAPDLTALGDLAADDAHAALTAVHGIGPWTADIYLLSCLGHADAWPAGDLALQEAARLAFSLAARPSTKEMGPLAEAWRPHRAVAARVLWTYYRAVKGREGAPTTPTIAPRNTPAAKISVATRKPADKAAAQPAKKTIKKIVKAKTATQRREKKHAR
jgi:DNA-3-methyladenine glycosylase II